MFKNMFKFSMFTLFVATLVACGTKTLSDNFDAEKIKGVSESIIQNFNTGDFNAIIEKGDDSLKSQLTIDQLEQAFESIGAKAGAFIELSPTIKYVEKNDYVTAVIIATYENQKIQYTLSYNTDMQLVGVYLK